MLEELVHGVIGFTEQFIVPDWGALVALIPVGLAGVVALFLVWTGLRFATAGPTRRGVRRLPPVTPPGIHMPGPSFAPLLAAFGVFMLFFGLIAGGLWLWVGLVVLVITLLYWGREALRDYDHLPEVAATHQAALVPVVPDRGPPPGVHMPPPSFRPLLISIAMTMLVAGLVIGGWALLFGFLAVVVTGLGWLRDARHEYVAVEEADRTGHLDLGGAPPWPRGTFLALAVIIGVTVVLTSGILPSGEDTAGGGGGVPGPTAAPGGGGAPAPTPVPLPEGDVVITADNIVFFESSVTVPAGREFTIVFDNREPVPHNVEILQGGTSVWMGDIFSGPEVRVYTVPAIPAGTYEFICTVHPNMRGTMTAG